MRMLDGNAVAGALADVLGADATVVRLRCASCASVDVVAGTALTLTPMGAVARCRTCGTALLTVVDDGVRTWLGMPGAAAIGIEHGAGG